MSVVKPPEIDVSQSLVNAIESFPTVREITHCGQSFTAPSLDIYATCPHCGTRIKVRSFSGVTELEDVFDAFATWLMEPAAAQLIRTRQAQIADD